MLNFGLDFARRQNKQGETIKNKKKSKEQLIKELEQSRKKLLKLKKEVENFKEVKEELRVERDKFKGIISSLSEGLDIIDKNYRICFQNKPLRDRFGDLTGKTCYEVYMGRQNPCEFCKLKKALKTGKTQKMKGKAPDGKYYEVTTTPFKDVDGETKVIEFVRDTTAQKQREEEYKKLIDGMNETAFVIDFEGNFIEVNDPAVEVLGYSRKELLTMGPTDIDPVLNEEDIKHLIKNMKKEGKQVFETAHRKKSGERFPVEVSSSLVSYQGRPVILSIARNIRKRKETEKALRENERQLSIIFDNSSDLQILFSYGKDGILRIVKVNKATVEIARSLGFDVSKENFVGKTVKDITTDFSILEQKSFKEINKNFAEARESGKPVFYEESYSFGNKKYNAEVSIIPVLDKKGEGEYVLWISHNITAYKETLAALKESEERFQTVIEKLPHGVCVHDLDGYMTLANKALCELTGYSEKELLNMNVQEVDHKSTSRDDRHNLWLKLKKGGSDHVESILHRKDGSTFPGIIYINAIELKGKPMILAITQDISERKKAFDKLQESEERFQTVIENLPHGLNVHDLDGNIRLVNKAICELTGYTREELIGMKVSEIDPQSQSRNDRKKLWLKLEKGGFTRLESTHRCKDGSTYPAEIYLNAITLKGEPMIVGIAHNITERKKAFKKLRESEEKYRKLHESMRDAYVRTDMKGRIVECNKHFSEMLGYTREEIKGLKWKDITPKEWHEPENIVKEKELLERGYTDVYEKEYIKKDGTVIPVELRGFLIKNEEGIPTGMWAIVRDITERKKTEEELRKIERLESLGVLAGGIAHDFNNLLTGILGNLSLIQTEETVDSKNIIEEAKQAAIQAKNLTQQLLTFSKGGEPIKGKVRIEDIINDSAKFALRGSNVKLKCGFSDNLWKVAVDKGQMSQVIDNLVINANQAMPEGGTISIRGENFILDRNNSLHLPGGKYVKITFRDEGIGVPEKYLSKIFDPYFSTKQEGSGLGLATVYSIIQRHGGHITVESDTGKGTSFFIYLPKAKKTAEKEEKKKTKETGTGHGKILIMDDEKIVRSAVERMLQKLGYKAETAENGEQAIRKYKEAMDSKEPIDIVILDLTVPDGMGGKKAMEELLKIDPNVKAIVSSGYSTDPIMANHKKHGFGAVVAKPFDLKELNQTIKKIL